MQTMFRITIPHRTSSVEYAIATSMFYHQIGSSHYKLMTFPSSKLSQLKKLLTYKCILLTVRTDISKLTSTMSHSFHGSVYGKFTTIEHVYAEYKELVNRGKGSGDILPNVTYFLL